MPTFMKLQAVSLFLALVFFAGTGAGQPKPGANLAGKQETVAYGQGVGRMQWTFPPGWTAILAVPHFTAGPRVKCGGKDFDCEVQVLGRDITVSDAERRRQLEEAIEPLLANTAGGKPALRTHGADAAIVYATLQLDRPVEGHRYLTVGYAHKGPALLKFQHGSAGVPDLAPLLRLVGDAKAIDALAMWALRLGDYRATCETRFPAVREANDRAFAASPFAAVDTVQAFMKLDPSEPEEAVRNGLAQARRGFAEEFDQDTPERRRAFCEGFPRWVEEAARGL